MKIGIIGASLGGLVAGDKLAKEGHDVTVIKGSQPVGGRMTSFYKDGSFFDYGIPFLETAPDASSLFTRTSAKQSPLHQWISEVPCYDGLQPDKMYTHMQKGDYFVCKNGFSDIPEHLKRWVDIKAAENAGGLTHIGANRGSKRSWMINLNDFSVFECDAVILAASAVESYGILQTAQDETAALRLIRLLDEIRYEPKFALMASYEHEMPEWKLIQCKNSRLGWICNDSSKTANSPRTNLTLHSSASFAREHADAEEEKRMELLLEEAKNITEESWITEPIWSRSYRWKYYKVLNPVDQYFMEMEMEEAPLAVIGDYFKGHSIEAEYRSAIKLADLWIDKYKKTVAINT
jgi:predicted NAD/FAD-dependent oxidoreductase